jgi:hypothetical protein
MLENRPEKNLKEMRDNSSSGNLSTRTAVVILSTVWMALMIICLCVGAWPMAIGFLIAPLFIPIIFYVCNLFGLLIFGVPFIFLGKLFNRFLPKKFITFATTRRLHPIVVILIFIGLFLTLLIIFRSLIGVIGGLCVVGFLWGLPMLADWSRRRKNKKSAIVEKDANKIV